MTPGRDGTGFQISLSDMMMMFLKIYHLVNDDVPLKRHIVVEIVEGRCGNRLWLACRLVFSSALLLRVILAVHQFDRAIVADHQFGGETVVAVLVGPLAHAQRSDRHHPAALGCVFFQHLDLLLIEDDHVEPAGQLVVAVAIGGGEAERADLVAAVCLTDNDVGAHAASDDAECLASLAHFFSNIRRAPSMRAAIWMDTACGWRVFPLSHELMVLGDRPETLALAHVERGSLRIIVLIWSSIGSMLGLCGRLGDHGLGIAVRLIEIISEL